jgi:hypothetical protein
MSLALAGDDDRRPARELKPSLEEAFRAWDKGRSSANREARVKALRSLLPTKEDIAYLFPKHAEKLWPRFEQGIQFLVENVDRFAREVTRGGAIEKVKAIDVRKDKDRASGSYKRLLPMIPRDVPVFELVVRRAKVSSGGGTYLHRNGRWFWIKDLEAFQKFLDQLK